MLIGVPAPLLLQNTDPALEKMLDKEYNQWSLRGYINVASLSIVVIVLVGLFAGWLVTESSLHTLPP